MRVIGGELRSRRLKSAPGLDTRPTPDRLRESLFNVLAPMIDESIFVDAYAGTGAVGIEALSRGASRVVFIERARPALHVLRENIAALGLADRSQVIVGNPASELAAIEAGIVFADPPYALVREYEALLEALGTKPPGLAVIQHSSKYDPGDVHGQMQRYRVLRQGDNSLSFYKPDET
jgi:16S rRNA (guanine(966)-N(2))-methyltransferase RsmD